MKRINNKGFTLIELVLVITILGILAVMALPQFFNITTAASDAARDGVVGAVRAGINTAYSNGLVTDPATTYLIEVPVLDAAADADGSAIFGNVLQQEVRTNGTVAAANAGWATSGTGLVYSYFGGTATCVYTYTPADGRFTGAPVASCP